MNERMASVHCEMLPTCPHKSTRQIEANCAAEAMAKAARLGWWVFGTQLLCPKCRQARLARIMQGPPPAGFLRLGLNK